MRVHQRPGRFLSTAMIGAFLIAAPAIAQPPGQGFPPPAVDPLLQRLDTNRDGELSAEEILAVPAALRALDRNGDGKLTADEIPAPRAGGGRGGPSRATRRLLETFDADKDGRLNREERLKAREEVQQNPQGFRRGGRGGPGGADREPPEPGPRVAVADAPAYPDHGLYDESIVRTLFLEFNDQDWEKELADFYRSDVHVPATLIVDGKTYSDIGVGFRGNSSFFTVGHGQKRSMNLTMDAFDQDLDLYGYRTINLLNAHTDPSFLRTTLYNHIARHYVPAPKTNFVRLVVNGESWGIYVNAQQANRDFMQEWFGSRDGVRWKVPAGGGGRSLNDLGPERSAYSGYELKSKDTEQSWSELARLCALVNSVPIDQLDTELDRVLNIDRALWFLALDNVLIDTDGYHSRGSDYLMYQDPEFGRFHVLPYDSNETFRTPGRGGGPGFGRGGPGGRPPRGRPPEQQPPPDPNDNGFGLSPFAGEDNPDLPLVNRLLANSRIRARYVAHVRTITDEWLDWNKVGPVIEAYRALIDDELKADTRMLYSYEAFVSSLEGMSTAGGRRGAPGLKTFVTGRREALDRIPELTAPAPVIESVSLRSSDRSSRGGEVTVVARVSGDVPVDSAMLYYSTPARAPFTALEMSSGAQRGTYTASFPPSSPGTQISYYVAVRAADDFGTTSFHPPRAELAALTMRVSGGSAIVINEALAANSSALRDSQGQYDDWIELYNSGDRDIDVGGMSLTDSTENPRKWSFPPGTAIAARGYLIVWMDGDESSEGECHASFKLSKNGETVTLVDQDGAVLDSVTWKNLPADVAFGRRSDGSGAFQRQTPTPGRANGR